MTDRELLEAAVRAAGVEVYRIGDRLFLSKSHSHMPTPFDPLADDGDALRLAVKLKIDLHFEDQPNWVGELVEAISPQNADGVANCEAQALGDDPNAAVRRAIVLAAAALAERGSSE
jgi:hypothetical protein